MSIFSRFESFVFQRVLVRPSEFLGVSGRLTLEPTIPVQVAVQAALRLDASFANDANEAKNYPVTKVVNLIKDMQVHARCLWRSVFVQDAIWCLRGRP